MVKLFGVKKGEDADISDDEYGQLLDTLLGMGLDVADEKELDTSVGGEEEQGERDIWIEGAIDMDVPRESKSIDLYDEVIKKVLNWMNEDEQKGLDPAGRVPIRLFINSEGGSVLSSLVLASLIRESKTPVYGFNMGECASAATGIFASCHRRAALPNSFFMFHSGYSGISSDSRDVRADMEFISELGERFDNLCMDALGLNSVQRRDYLSNKQLTNHYIFEDQSGRYNLTTDTFEDLLRENLTS